MEVTFHGVRGAIPAPGPETVRYGGNTSCVSLRSSLGQLLILDSGTGIIALGKALLQTEFGKGKGHAAILLSHAHWDHIQGFPFFAPIFILGNRFAVFGPARSSSMLEGMLEGQVNPHFSPLYTMKNLGASFDLLPMHGDPEDKPLWWEQVAISARQNPHGKVTCMAYRVEEHGCSVVYAPDAGYPPGGPSEKVIDLYRGADLLIHDATYTPEDRAQRLARLPNRLPVSRFFTREYTPRRLFFLGLPPLRCTPCRACLAARWRGLRGSTFLTVPVGTSCASTT